MTFDRPPRIRLTAATAPSTPTFRRAAAPLRKSARIWSALLWIYAGCWHPARAAESTPVVPLPDTRPLETQADITSELVDGVDRFLLREIDRSVQGRQRFWHRDFSSAEAYNRSIQPNRERLAHILGVRDARKPVEALEYVRTTSDDGVLFRTDTYEVRAVRWPVFGDVHGEGLLMGPPGSFDTSTQGGGTARPIADVIAVPDADQTPEQIAFLVDGIAPESQFARKLAERGLRVLVPTLINRKVGERKVGELDRGLGLSNREFLYRSAFELGRQLAGYEVQKILAAVDWFAQDRSGHAADGKPGNPDPTPGRIGVIGWGEGGLLALYAAALDPRIDAACVSGAFDDRKNTWQEPIDRNVFGLLEQFGGAELASMVAPRALIVEASRWPDVTIPGQGGGAPARLITPPIDDVRSEFERARAMARKFTPNPTLELVVSGDGSGSYGSDPAIDRFLDALIPGERSASSAAKRPSPVLAGRIDTQARHTRQMHELDRHNQWLLRESPYVRKDFMKDLKTDSLEDYTKSVEPYRKFFYDEVIGRVDQRPMAPAIRSRKAYDTPKWTGYEVVMDVFPDVIAYGILLLPKDLKPGEQRPVVVCQHGLEGRPQDVIEGDKGAYHDYAARLADRGYITFAPQNLYIFQDRFRTLQRKANLVKKTLFSIITPQHQQIVDWLKTLPYVDSSRIAFYGLSYGGKTAMRVPGLVPDYCLSICSADFNEWVWKNASSRSPYSYVWTGEYEIFEFDLGSTFNYSEMAALVAPRPFMVERGHFDGVAPDETVGYEFAKVRNLYSARLGIGDRCELEWFVGPHTIHGKGTFDFLQKHLNWH